MTMLILHTVPKPEPTVRALTFLEVLIVQDPSPRICFFKLALQKAPFFHCQKPASTVR